MKIWTSRHTIILISSILILVSSCAPLKENSAAWSVQNQKNHDRLLIYDATLKVIPNNTDSFPAQVWGIASNSEGYLLNKNDGFIEIRITAKYLNEALASLNNLGKVKHQNIHGQDITDEYTDYQIRLENAEKSRDRYINLLSAAMNISETLKIEKELERLNGTIDLLKGKINKLDHLHSYATIRINYPMESKPGLLSYVGIGVYKSVKWLFIRG